MSGLTVYMEIVASEGPKVGRASPNTRFRGYFGIYTACLMSYLWMSCQRSFLLDSPGHFEPSGLVQRSTTDHLAWMLKESTLACLDQDHYHHPGSKIWSLHTIHRRRMRLSSEFADIGRICPICNPQIGRLMLNLSFSHGGWSLL